MPRIEAAAVCMLFVITLVAMAAPWLAPADPVLKIAAPYEPPSLSYLFGTDEIGRDVLSFRREDGVAENFKTSQNRELLEKLSQQTGGRYYTPAEASKLTNEISYSEAGITTRETRDLWDMPVIFLLALAFRASEWMLRRKWGVV